MLVSPAAPTEPISAGAIRGAGTSCNASRTTVGALFAAAYPMDHPMIRPSVTGTSPSRKRGLLGNFIGASLGAQFEAMSCDWLNLGLQDPRITGSNDPIAGANDPGTSWFDLPLKSGGTIRLWGLPRFVWTRGGAYTFLPSLSAIRFLGSQMM